MRSTAPPQLISQSRPAGRCQIVFPPLAGDLRADVVRRQADVDRSRPVAVDVEIGGWRACRQVGGRRSRRDGTPCAGLRGHHAARNGEPVRRPTVGRRRVDVAASIGIDPPVAHAVVDDRRRRQAQPVDQLGHLAGACAGLALRADVVEVPVRDALDDPRRGRRAEQAGERTLGLRPIGVDPAVAGLADVKVRRWCRCRRRARPAVGQDARELAGADAGDAKHVWIDAQVRTGGDDPSGHRLADVRQRHELDHGGLVDIDAAGGALHGDGGDRRRNGRHLDRRMRRDRQPDRDHDHPCRDRAGTSPARDGIGRSASAGVSKHHVYLRGGQS